jgi:predicted nucleotide-binding protein with TIR-like domain
MGKPRIFLGSSGKQEKLLQALTRGLADVGHVKPWTTSFNPGTTTLERLLELAHEVDFAAFVFARDDWTTNSPPASDPTASGQAARRVIRPGTDTSVSDRSYGALEPRDRTT